MSFGLQIGTLFGSLSSYLWWAAGLLLAAGSLSVLYLLSFLWHLPERMPKIKGSILLKPGDSGLPKEPPKRLTAAQIAKMMVLVAALLLAYDVGQRTNRSAEHEHWKVIMATYQKDFATWAARQPQENK
jgi:hypothetical protein